MSMAMRLPSTRPVKRMVARRGGLQQRAGPIRFWHWAELKLGEETVYATYSDLVQLKPLIPLSADQKDNACVMAKVVGLSADDDGEKATHVIVRWTDIAARQKHVALAKSAAGESNAAAGESKVAAVADGTRSDDEDEDDEDHIDCRPPLAPEARIPLGDIVAVFPMSAQ